LERNIVQEELDRFSEKKRSPVKDDSQQQATSGRL
jgi:hypothetical protein